ncbi:MAG: 2,3-epoxybenzoyl-CoA dihydrolase [Rhodospirillales bacterium]|nr:2,3-epoxybenzoyl-CoA dihydrolase [Rhodospirillales bacterium]
MIDFRTNPNKYRHWSVDYDGSTATLTMDIAEDGGLVPGYELKLNSYDLGVDIELYDAIQRLRFEHPEVKSVIVTSAKEKVFCSGANISMLGQSTHHHKVNFCKFTNETRNSIEDASENSGQKYFSAVNGTAAGGGYELALATDHIILVDDGTSAVSLPEVPLLAVLPGTGGLTRVVDKRYVRRDHADFFCTINEGIKGKRAVSWKLVDEIVPLSKLMDVAKERADEWAAKSDRPSDAKGVEFTEVSRTIKGDEVSYDTVSIKIDRTNRTAEITAHAPTENVPSDIATIEAQGVKYWPLAFARDMDDAILHLRANEIEIGTWVFKTSGDADKVESADQSLLDNASHWLVRETTLFIKRVFKRIDVTSRSLITVVDPGSCFTGTFLEFLLVADRSFMLDGTYEGDNRPAPTVRPTGMNFGPLEMCNGLTRLQTRFLDTPEKVEEIADEKGNDIDAAGADEFGLVTFIPDDLDWDDEVRIAIEERASFSPDACTGMEASLRWAGPETMETKIFGRLSAWQNWIFQRPNAVGADGALKLFGTGKQATYDLKRV